MNIHRGKGFRLILFLWLANVLMAMGHNDPHPRSRFDFVANQGQWDASVLFRADLRDAVVYIQKDALLFVLRDQAAVDRLTAYKASPGIFPPPQEDAYLVDHYAFRQVFLNTNKGSKASGKQARSYYLNFFQGNDPANWSGGVPAFASILVEEIYPGIDLLLSTEEGNLKYAWKVDPGCDPANIRFTFDPEKKVKKDAAGRLSIPTPFGAAKDAAPLAWTVKEGRKEFIDCRFKLFKKTEVGFSLQAYSPSDTLIIDPVLSFASYSGSTADNWGYTATYDEEGFLYAGGIAFGTGFPVTTGAYQVNFGTGTVDIAISKYDTSGSFLRYSTYLGGSGNEVPSSLVVNNSNELIVLGTTGSSDFPIPTGAYDPSFNQGIPYTLTNVIQFPMGADLVLARFSPDGTQLLSASYFGGNGNDGLNMTAPLKKNYGDDIRGEIIVDDQDNIYLVSSTSSTNIPVSSGVIQATYGGGGQDAIIAKFSRDMAVRIWATYAGGNGLDAGYSLTLGKNGEVYASGGTTSVNLNTNGGHQPSFGGGTSSDGFIYRLANDGKSLLGATYCGSNRYDQSYFIETNKNGEVYVLGQTSDTSGYFIDNVSWFQPQGGQFISKYHPSLANRIWSTAWGTGNGGPDVSPSAFMVDVCNNIYLSAWGGNALNGFGGTAGLPLTPDALYASTDDADYYFLVLNPDVSQPLYATFYGGSSSEHVDGGTSRFDRKGIIYQSVCAGCGGKDDFPTTPGAWSQLNGSTNCNNGVIKMDFELPLVIADFQSIPSGCAPYSVNMVDKSKGINTTPQAWEWDFGDGATSNLQNPTHTWTSSGIFPVTLVVSDSAACNYADTLIRYVVVLSGTSDSLPDLHICQGDLVQIGLPPSPDTAIQYQWSPPAGLSDTQVPNPVANITQNQDYQLIISNGQCADTLFQRISVHVVEVDLGPDTALCENHITLNASVNKAGLTFHWSSLPDFSNILNTNIYADSLTLTISGAQSIYLKVSDGLCEATDSIRIDFLIISAPIQVHPPSCYGDCNGWMWASASGGTPPYTFEWSSGHSSDTASNLCAGNYTVSITDAQGCVSISGETLNQPPPLTDKPSGSTLPCQEVCIGTLDPNIGGGTPPYQYLWEDGSTQASANGLCAGPYAISVTDQNGCVIVSRDTLEVDWVFENMEVWASPDTIFRGQQAYISATSIPGITYQWEPAFYVVSAGLAETMVFPEQTTTFALSATDSYGCQYSDSLKIWVKDVICREPYIYIPNAFTPNGDQLNDQLFVRSSVAAEMTLMVYDRWGVKVFETMDQQEGWDGNFNGKKCEQGVYVYYLEVRCFDQQVFEKKGNVTLIR